MGPGDKKISRPLEAQKETITSLYATCDRMIDQMCLGLDARTFLFNYYYFRYASPEQVVH
jgi:hypothetical protein